MDYEKRVKGNREEHWNRWDSDRNRLLLMCLFAGLPERGTWGRLNIVGTTEKGVSRQLYKIAQNYSEYGKRKTPEVDLGDERSGLPWSDGDYWIIRAACLSVGIEHGANSPGYLAKVLGRQRGEVADEMLRLAKARKGFGFVEVDSVEIGKILSRSSGVQRLDSLLEEIR